MKARILTTLLLASAMLTTQMTTSLPGAALDLARPAQPMEVAIHTGRIAFASDRDENWEVCTMNADGSQPTNLSNYPLGGGYAWPSTDVKPSWSPTEGASPSPPTATSTSTWTGMATATSTS